ncbi:polymorphic toxin-type HINT domain-containing protein [Kitasatospora sp. NPDC085895]|uniref:polymorphic toxin-type HINT domain-containing protein n=1 Tax=Kitasatospora sp. NPDC085895 TaxID=3155057 RepID=UPI00344FAE50
MSPGIIRTRVGGGTLRSGLLLLSRGLLPLVLLSGSVVAVPAAADEAPPQAAAGLPPTDRAKVIGYWKSGGPAVKSAAEAALLGNNDAVSDFLAKGRAAAQEVDDRQLALQIVSIGGRAVREAAKNAVQKSLDGDNTALAAFLNGGWKPLQEQDDRVAVVQEVTAGGRGVREAGQKALNNGDPAAVLKFLQEDRYRLREQDDRVAVVQAISAGGPASREAGQAAFNGSPEDIRDFLDVGKYVAQGRDAEYASIQQLADQVAEANTQVDVALAKTKDEAARAIDAANMARAAAAKAAEETAAAKSDAVKATAAAARAAEATRRAGQAAQTAASAARAAMASARVAANAASQTNVAAAGALQEAVKALNAAAFAATDAKQANAAKDAAKRANALIATFEQGGDFRTTWSRHAKEASDAAGVALHALNDAKDQVEAAAASAEASANYADQASGTAAEARAAAAAARRHAAAASQACAAAQRFAAQAATAAGEAADLADSALVHLKAAAKAADEAALHAGEASAAADRAKAQADAAKVAADAATAAVKKQESIRKLTDEMEQEELNARTNEGIEQARDLRAASEEKEATVRKAIADAKQLDADAAKLAAEAAAPGATEAQIAPKGRQMALAAMKTRGPFSQSAAEFALAQPDAAVVDYARSGWALAAERDERARIKQMIRDSEVEDDPDAKPTPLATAAKAALQGDGATVHAFIVKGQYDAQATDLRVRVVQAINDGGPGVKQAGQAAINDGSSTALVDFLTTGLGRAQETDDRVLVTQAVSSGTAEVKAAARIAFEGPKEALRAFLTTGQQKARQKDELTARHDAAIDQIIAQSTGTAATAQQNAAEAARLAALARNAAAEANNWATQAQNSAAEATKAANDAKAAAVRAADSAAKAAGYAKSARESEGRAQRAARSATASASWASTLAVAARSFADQAGKAAIEARASAEAAGKSQQEASREELIASDKAFNAYMDDLEWEKQFDQMLAEWRAKSLGELETRFSWLDGIHLLLDVIGLVPGVGEPADLVNCAIYGLERNYVDAGLSCASAIPFEGYLASAVKFEKWGEKGLDLLKQLNRDRRYSSLAPGCLTKNSFPAGTRVLMADGSAFDIQKVQVGDLVLAGDPESGANSARRVNATISTPDDRDFTEITVVSLDGSQQKITSTDHHPFWAPSRHAWMDAADLMAGDSVQTSSGQSVKISTVRHWKSLTPAYNLTVNSVHTYYVLAGNTPVLVHNACGGLGGFKVGVTPDEISEINLSFGGDRLMNGSPENALINADRYGSFWEKSAVLIRDIAGSHMFNNGNKRTAVTVVQKLMDRNNIMSGPSSEQIWVVVGRVADSREAGHTMDVGEIAKMLRGF